MFQPLQGILKEINDKEIVITNAIKDIHIWS
jgi:hypothetical protein